jgi:hypothetical protein
MVLIKSTKFSWTTDFTRLMMCMRWNGRGQSSTSFRLSGLLTPVVLGALTMDRDRRRLIVTAASGLGTLLVPGVSNACCFHRRCRGRTALIGSSPYSTTLPCPGNFGWSPNYSAPSSVSQTNAYQFVVAGTGLAAWQQAGNGFLIQIKDNTYPVSWTVSNNPAPSAGSGNPYDPLTFYASETGSTSGTSSTITITVSLLDRIYTLCANSWPQQLTYH